MKDKDTNTILKEQTEPRRMAVLLHSPDLLGQVANTITENSWHTDAAKYLWGKLERNYAVTHTSLPINLVADLVSQKDSEAYQLAKKIGDTTPDIIQAAARNIVATAIANPPSKEEIEYFTTDIQKQSQKEKVYQAVSAYGKTCNIDALLSDVSEIQASSSKTLPQAVNMRTLCQLPNTDAKCLLNDWAMERGETIAFVAPAGVGKSVFANQLCVYLSAGKETLGIKPNGKMKVLYIQNEDTQNTMARQKDGATQYLTADEKEDVYRNLLVFRLRGLSGKAFIMSLATLIHTHKPDIVVINPISKYFGGDECNPKDVVGFFNDIEPILDKYQCGLILVAHTKKQSITSLKEGLEDEYSQYGSAKWGDFIRATMRISRTNRQGTFILQASRKRSSQLGWQRKIIKWSNNANLPYWEECSVEEQAGVTIDFTKRQQGEDTRKEILDLIPFAPMSITKQEVADIVGKQFNCVSQHINALLGEKRIVKVDTDGNNKSGRQSLRFQRLDTF